MEKNGNLKKEIITSVTTVDVERRMVVLRNQHVLIDADVAVLYGVQTKEINQAVRNNPQKFPFGYIFQLNKKEKEDVVKIFDRLEGLKFSSCAPTAFTERNRCAAQSVQSSSAQQVMK